MTVLMKIEWSFNGLSLGKIVPFVLSKFQVKITWGENVVYFGDIIY